MDKSNNHVLIIASGGIDSTACINFYKNLNFDISLIFFDYNQAARKKEHDALCNISKYYKTSLKKVTIKDLGQFKNGLVLGRNAAFYFLALINFNKPNGIIASGIHYGTNYYDCSERFLSEIQIIVEQYSQGTIKIEAPFVNFTKTEIINYCQAEKVPLELTYSCELGKKQPCGKCATCKDLIAIYAIKNK